MTSLVKCCKPDCGRMVKVGVAYCCDPCASAAEGHYEIERHTAGCDQRANERENDGGQE